jgi:hypothetical protein
MDELIEQVRALPPERKVELLEAIGMRRTGYGHDFDCQGRNTSSPCSCVETESTWTHPEGVEEYLGETWEARLERAQERMRKRDEREREQWRS